MADETSHILTEVADYYSAKLAEHGETGRGVDWDGEESQTQRFAQLIKIIDRCIGFSLNDLGCGYGALIEYLTARYQYFTYSGYDVSADMIRTAKIRYADRRHVRFGVAAEPLEIADYSIASGIFNVRLRCSNSEWQRHLETTLDALDRTSRRGFAFNCLTSYSDADKMRADLYYANPAVLFDWCKRRYSRHVALLHDYGLYEFTILVRKHP